MGLLLVLFWSPHGGIWIPQAKFASGFETDTPHTPRGYEEFYYSHNQAFWEEQGRLQRRSKNSLRKQGEATGVFWWLGVGLE